MSVYSQVKKAHQDELLRTAARHRLAVQARRTRPRGRTTRVAAPARRLAAMRLRRLFS